jgi:hypothetical protein
MVSHKTLPNQFVNRENKLMDLYVDNVPRLFPFEALKVDAEGNGWLDPNAVWDENPGPYVSYLSIQRTPLGFVVDLYYAGGHRWPIEAKPNTDIDGGTVPWFPVEEFRTRF